MSAMSLKFIPPFAKRSVHKMKTRGRYAKGWPSGAIVHYTAGSDGAENVIRGGVKSGYTYWCLQRDGLIFCAHEANEWGYHAGESRWKNLVGGVSDDLIGIEINAAGTVKADPKRPGKFVTYFGTTLDANDVRYSKGVANQAKGYYHKYTPEQEKTLIETLIWLKHQQPSIFSFDNVLGHDEVSGPTGLGKFIKRWFGKWRKVDPGAALSMTMPEFRELLKKEYKSRYG